MCTHTYMHACVCVCKPQTMIMLTESARPYTTLTTAYNAKRYNAVNRCVYLDRVERLK